MKRSFGLAFKSPVYSDRTLQIHVANEGQTEQVSSSEHAGTGDTKELEADEIEAGEETGALVSGTVEIPVIRGILASNSVYFQRMFESGLRESGEKEQPIQIHLPASDVQPFQALIRFLYTDEIPSEEENLVALLKIADQFESPPCVARCVSALTDLPMSLEKALFYLALPETIKRAPEAKPLMDAVTGFVGWGFEEVAEAASVEELSFEAVKRLLDADIGASCEELLFSCFLRWARSIKLTATHESVLDQLASKIRFAFMDPEFLEEEVAAAPEMQTPTGQLYIQEARAFLGASPALSKQLRDRCKDCRLMPRQGPSHVNLHVSRSDDGKWVVDAVFSVHESARLEQYGVTSKEVVIFPGVYLAIRLFRMPPKDKEEDVDTVGIFVMLKALPAGCNGVVSARYTYSLLNKETKTYETRRVFDYVFHESKDSKSPDWGTRNIGITWKEFCLRDTPFLMDGNLDFRVTFDKLMLD